MEEIKALYYNNPFLTIKAARINKNYTVEQAADILGIHTNTLRKYEKYPGEVPPDIRTAMARLYGFRTNMLIFFN